MKQLTEPTLTGIDHIDKYLVTRCNLLDFTNVRYSDVKALHPIMFDSVMCLWELLASELKPETFQAIIETTYSEGYLAHLTDYAKKHGYKSLSDVFDQYSDIRQEIVNFTDYVTSSTNLWSFEIVKLLTEKPRLFVTADNKPMANDWISVILYKTKDIKTLEYLKQHPYSDIRFNASERLSRLKN